MIDSQHKELIEKMNQLLESCENGNDKLTAVKTLDYLEDYTDYHFKAEEQLQRDIDYPGYEKHIAQHEIFLSLIHIFFIRSFHTNLSLANEFNSFPL